MKKPAKSPLPFDQQVARLSAKLNGKTSPLPPPKDAIPPSEDVMDAMDVSKEDVRGDGEDCTKMVALSESKKDTWHENPYLPTQPGKLGTQEKRDRYLAILEEKKYHVWAAPEFGCSYWTVMRRMQEDVDFAAAAALIIERREKNTLAKIEAFSEEMALTNSKVTDRAMQLNALGYGKYKRDAKGTQVATQVNIMIGFSPPKHRGT